MIHWSVWASLIFIIIVLVVFSNQSRSGYAPPRDENTMPPFTENTSNQYQTQNNSPYIESTGITVPADNQTQIYKDMGGLDFQLQSSNPILNFIQGDPLSNSDMYGDFTGIESDGGSAYMYNIPAEDLISTSSAIADNGQYIPEITSPAIPFLGKIPLNPPLMSPDMKGSAPGLNPTSSIMANFNNTPTGMTVTAPEMPPVEPEMPPVEPEMPPVEPEETSVPIPGPEVLPNFLG